MAQKRMIDRKISVSEDVATLPISAQLLFTWMIPHADDVGLLPISPRSIKALVMPMVDIRVEDIGNHLEAMRNQNLIDEFQFGKDKFWRIVKFRENQTIKKDRQPQTLLKIQLFEHPKDSWNYLDSILETSGIHLEPEVKELRKEIKERSNTKSLDKLKQELINKKII